MNTLFRYLIPLALVIAIVLLVGRCSDSQDSAQTSTAAPVFVNPAQDVAVGEWIQWKHDNGRREKWTIVRANRTQYWTRHETWREGDETHQVEKTEFAVFRGLLGVKSTYILTSLRPEKITVAGKEWSTWRAEFHSLALGVVFTYWLSPEAPLAGVVRRRHTADDTTFTMEIERWSFK